jgi:hypothetical protein
VHLQAKSIHKQWWSSCLWRLDLQRSGLACSVCSAKTLVKALQQQQGEMWKRERTAVGTRMLVHACGACVSIEVLNKFTAGKCIRGNAIRGDENLQAVLFAQEQTSEAHWHDKPEQQGMMGYGAPSAAWNL